MSPGNYECLAISSNPLELDRFIQLMNLKVNRKIKRPNKIGRLSDKTELRILVFIETQYSKLGRSLIEFLQSAKFK